MKLILAMLLLFAAVAQAPAVDVPGSGNQAVFFSGNDVAGATTAYLQPTITTGGTNTTESPTVPTAWVSSVRGIARSMRCSVATTPTAGTTWTLTFRVAQTATAGVCTLTDPALSCGPVLFTAPINVGDMLSVQQAESGAGIDGATIFCIVMVQF